LWRRLDVRTRLCSNSRIMAVSRQGVRDVLESGGQVVGGACMDGTDIEGKERPAKRAIYAVDPLARLLLDRLGIGPYAMASVALAWGVVFLLVIPAAYGCLRGQGGYLGSLDDWHAQLLLLLVFPTVCAFYVWQPEAITRVYEAMHERQRLVEGGGGYRRRVWLWLSIAMGTGIVLFDSPKMVANYGTWWMCHNWLTILGREASLASAFYLLSMMAWREFVATLEWRKLLPGQPTEAGLRAASTYGLSWAFLVALLALRLSIEAIELPRRAGAITPDYYAKVAAYLVASVCFFCAPTWGGLGKHIEFPGPRLRIWLEWAGIVALPLLGFLVLRLALGP
jgi:hypothetical protein